MCATTPGTSFSSVVKRFIIPETMTKRPSGWTWRLLGARPLLPTPCSLLPAPPTSSSFSVCDFSRATVVLRSVFSSSNCCTLAKKHDAELRVQGGSNYREGSQSPLPEERNDQLGDRLRQNKYLTGQLRSSIPDPTVQNVPQPMMMPQTKILHYRKAVSRVKLLAKSDEHAFNPSTN